MGSLNFSVSYINVQRRGQIMSLINNEKSLNKEKSLFLESVH